MEEGPITIRSFPRAILHIDGDAFFASCEQARNPALKGKPVITGKERGIAASMSYEAKALGVTRAMKLHEIKRLIPNAIILPSDYETYSLLSKRFFNIVRRFTPDVEEYGIDECFADLTGMRRTLRMSYLEIAEKLRKDLEVELGFTFSIGLAPNKSLAKIGSKWNKPNGLTVIPGREIHLFLKHLPAEKVWGIGPQTGAYLLKHGIKTALEFAIKNEGWIKSHLSKPFYEIWQELNGDFALPLNLVEKTTQYSIQKFKTFTPPSTNRDFIFSQLSKNIENACIKARRYKLAARNIYFVLRTQNFHHAGIEIKLSRPTAFPSEIIDTAAKVFSQMYLLGVKYRGTGVTLSKLEDDEAAQQDLFGAHLKIEKMHRVYQSVDAMKRKYGKHTIYLGTSFLANRFQQHKGERGDAALRSLQEFKLKGENKRRRLGIPMFTGEVT